MPTNSMTPVHRTLGDFSWQDRAACRSTEANPFDPEMFFPEPDELDRIEAAKRLCSQCPVEQICLDAALEAGDTDGIRGGLTEEERASLHRKLKRRVDYARINAAFAGRDIHLTEAERQVLIHAAYKGGTPASRLAWILKFTEEHAHKLYREQRRKERNRAMGKRKGKTKAKSASRKKKATLTRADVQAAA
ncbi:WhiB family transcriptional regulator [Streptomyces silvisoli]|uniref:Transcriptional regulator WhiB n=1 Tax=Streptomyces silvisoli TaxID=3034235 RepID=A0ABT5ZQH4_9ACTN|nr:WhiB family transcriptional regulator [Streptomyces silvisoli]MDF3291906.1 WhiB family transcriptional regulator [Streptomyces silvisoli]